MKKSKVKYFDSPKIKAFKDNGGRYIPSPDEILFRRTGGGGWKSGVLADWGVSYPPQGGWRMGLEAEYHRLMDKYGFHVMLCKVCKFSMSIVEWKGDQYRFHCEICDTKRLREDKLKVEEEKKRGPIDDLFA